MHIETKTKNTRNCLTKSFMASLCITLSACSFVELKHGAENIIFAQKGDDCELVKALTVEVKTSTLFIDRRPEAIANELQILAQNEAYSIYANAIWPSSEIKDGKQTFEILKCAPERP